MLAWGLDAVLQEVPRVETEVKLCVLSRSVVSGCSATPWTVAHQAPLSMGFSQQEYWSGLPCPPPGGLPNAGIQPVPPALQADSLPLSQLGSPNKAVSELI